MAKELEELKDRIHVLEAKLANTEHGVSVAQMWDFFNERAIGTKEFRNFLAKVDPNFAAVRDPDVDNEIDANARRIAEEAEAARQIGTSVIGKDGQIQPQ